MHSLLTWVVSVGEDANFCPTASAFVLVVLPAQVLLVVVPTSLTKTFASSVHTVAVHLHNTM